MKGMHLDVGGIEYVVVFLTGLIFGAVAVLLINRLRRKDAKELARELVSETEAEKIVNLERLLDKIKDSFGAMSLDVLSKNSNAFLRLANETLSKQTRTGEKELEVKKKLIDQSLEVMKEDLQRVQSLVTRLENDREQRYGELSAQLKAASEQTMKLQDTTAQLHMVLSNTKTRGQWGERMAEDVLRMAGFMEGINFRRQKSLESSNTRPDYTFHLPHGLIVNMDVKFPLDNYIRYMDAEGTPEKVRLRNLFLRDVKKRIKEVLTREYINPEENTVDYVIVFIPNEQVYSFINEQDSSILDEALKNKVILSSPITLYAILSIIRQAVDNFNLERTTAEIVKTLSVFHKQWDAFVNSLERMGKKIDETQKEFTYLTTTRRTQLERPLRRIEEIREQRVENDLICKAPYK